MLWPFCVEKKKKEKGQRSKDDAFCGSTVS